MADPAFDTLEAARRLEAADIQAEQADAIVEVVNQSARQMVTAERFETGVTGLHARIDSVHSDLGTRIGSGHSDLGTRVDSIHTELLARIDSVRAELRAEFARSVLIAVGIVIGANTLIATIITAIFGILLTNGAFGIVTFGAP